VWAVASTVVLLPVTVDRWPDDLQDGPLPIPLTSPGGAAIVTDRERRSTFFNTRTAAVLYGGVGDVRRGHRDVEHRVNESVVTAVELWQAHGAAGVLMVHADLSTHDPVGALEVLTASPKTGRPTPLIGGVLGIDDADPGLLGGAVTVAQAVRPFGVSFLAPAGELPPGAHGIAGSQIWSPHRQWLFATAAGRSPAAFPLDPEDESPLVGLVRMSADWGALVLRDGAGFVGRTPAVPASFLAEHADAYVRSIYADAFALGLIQSEGISAFSDRLATIDTATRDLRPLLSLQEDVTRFRAMFWWQHLSAHGTGSQLLRALQQQRDLGALMDQVVTELGDYTQQAELRLQREESRRLGTLNVVVSILTVLGIPLGVMQLMVDTNVPARWSARWLWLALLVVTLLAVVTRPWWRPTSDGTRD
jgi:hypothetical protein